MQLDNLFRPIVTNTLNIRQFQKIRSTCIIKVGCPFSTCLALPLNSKRGSEHCSNLADIAQEKSRANIEQKKDNFVRNILQPKDNDNDADNVFFSLTQLSNNFLCWVAN